MTKSISINTVIEYLDLNLHSNCKDIVKDVLILIYNLAKKRLKNR